MFLHSATFEWDTHGFIHEDDQDIETVLLLPKRGIGRVHLERVENDDRAVLFLTEDDIERMDEDTFPEQPAGFQRLVRAIIDYTQTHPPSTGGEYTFVLTY